jgi:hypothetical protein
MTTDIKDRMAAARSAKTINEAAKNSEIEALKRELEQVRAQAAAAAATEEDVSIGVLPNRDPIHGMAEELRRGMEHYVQEQIKAAIPERGDPIRSREVARDGRTAVRRNATIAHDREGNPIHRRRDSVSDPFGIPADLIEQKWDRQWVRVSVHGWEDVDNQVNMQENGWRPISANRPGWEGRFMPPGYTGAIQKGGLMLMERPIELTQEARQEERRIVRGQTETQRNQFGMALPSGFVADTPAARANTMVRVGKPEATPSALKPTHEIREGIEID